MEINSKKSLKFSAGLPSKSALGNYYPISSSQNSQEPMTLIPESKILQYGFPEIDGQNPGHSNNGVTASEAPSLLGTEMEKYLSINTQINVSECHSIIETYNVETDPSA